MTDPPQAGPAPRPPYQSERRTVSRPAGFLIAAGTAVLVFAGGSVVWPVHLPEPRLAPPTALPPTPALPSLSADARPATDASLADSLTDRSLDALDAVVDSSGADGGSPPGGEQSASQTEGTIQPQAGPASERERRGGKKRRNKENAAAKSSPTDGSVPADGADDASKPENAPFPPSDGTASAPPVDSAAKDAAGDCALPEKDMAREAWRRNWPTVCALPAVGKAFILIPIKGSVEGETHALHRRPNREARINLPEGSESQLTLKQYKINRLGFKDVRVNSAEGGGKARVRVKLLPSAGDPLFEIKEGYAKITVSVPIKD